MTQDRKTFAEFFAGIGLVHAGLIPSGWRCTYANDIDPKKLEMYRGEFGDQPYLHLEDIWCTEQITRRLPIQPFLATASFPCTDLSLAGAYSGFDGKQSSTYFGFIQVLQRLRNRKPKLVMLENVLGFIKSKGGAEFSHACQLLANEGYYLDAFILDAKYFVPQSRPRVFVIGIHRSVRSSLLIHESRSGNSALDEWASAITHDTDLRPNQLTNLMMRTELPTGWVATPISRPSRATFDLRELIDKGEDQDWWERDRNDKHIAMLSERHRAMVDKRRHSPELHVGTVYRRKRDGGTKAEVRFDGLAGCLRTPRGGSARQIVVVVGQGKIRFRWMSPREYARLQGAPDFSLPTNTVQALFGFGDGVCVPVIEHIDRNVLTPIFDEVVTKSQVDDVLRRETARAG